MVNLLSRMSYGFFFFFFFHHPCNTWYLQFTGFSSCVRDLKRVSWKTLMGRIAATSPGRQGRGQSKQQHSTRAWAPRWEVLHHTWKSSAQETELLTATCLLMCPSLIDNNKIARKKMWISSEKKNSKKGTGAQEVKLRDWILGTEALGLKLREWSSWGTRAQGLKLNLWQWQLLLLQKFLQLLLATLLCLRRECGEHLWRCQVHSAPFQVLGTFAQA